jgi:hypothetical protein
VTRFGGPLPDIPGGHIEYSILYAEAQTAKEWGLTPSMWAMEPRWSRATMMAQVETEAKVRWWTVEDNRRK